MSGRALLLVMNKHEDTMSFVDTGSYEVPTTIGGAARKHVGHVSTGAIAWW